MLLLNNVWFCTWRSLLIQFLVSLSAFRLVIKHQRHGLNLIIYCDSLGHIWVVSGKLFLKMQVVAIKLLVQNNLGVLIPLDWLLTLSSTLLKHLFQTALMFWFLANISNRYCPVNVRTNVLLLSTVKWSFKVTQQHEWLACLFIRYYWHAV